MRNLLIVLLALLTTVGCRDGQFVRKSISSNCGGGGMSLSGYTLTAIHYGDSRLFVVPISSIRPESEFRFRLLPRIKKTDPPINYEDAIVSITSSDDDGDTPADWLDVSGPYSAGTNLVTCVPKDGGLLKDDYKYDVRVSWPGTDPGDTLSLIDPRVRIIRD